MATKIPWVVNPDGTPGVTWNPVTGCTPISAGCKNCYAKRMATRLKGRFGYPEDDPFEVTIHDDRLLEPFKWKKPKRIFVCSMGDLFHENVPDDYIHDVFQEMVDESGHTYIVLTKRPQRLADFLFKTGIDFDYTCRPHIWLGVSVENQKTADERIPILLKTPAAHRFVSVEPMLGPVNLLDRGYLADHEWGKGVPGGINWVICGGESGHGARSMNPDWARTIRDQCVDANVPFFLKQMPIDGQLVKMPELDGKTWQQVPWRM